MSWRFDMKNPSMHAVGLFALVAAATALILPTKGFAATVKEVVGDCKADRSSGKQFRKQIWMDTDDDGKFDYVRTIWCDGKTSMSDPPRVVDPSRSGDLSPKSALEPRGWGQ